MTSLLNVTFCDNNSTLLANHILNHTILLIGGYSHRICEIEFYCRSKEHPDEYVHCHNDQTITGSWYFHKSSSKSKSYRGGTFKGLDIVLGNQESIGGFLLRSIYSPIENRYIEGPCNTVNYILKILQKDSIISLTDGNTLYLDSLSLSLIDSDSNDIQPVRVGPRIGLSNKYPNYQKLPYRYVIGDIKKQKTSLSFISIC